MTAELAQAIGLTDNSIVTPDELAGQTMPSLMQPREFVVSKGRTRLLRPDAGGPHSPGLVFVLMR